MKKAHTVHLLLCTLQRHSLFGHSSSKGFLFVRNKIIKHVSLLDFSFLSAYSMKYIYIYIIKFIDWYFFNTCKSFYIQKSADPPTSEDCLSDSNILHNTRTKKKQKKNGCVLETSRGSSQALFKSVDLRVFQLSFSI